MDLRQILLVLRLRWWLVVGLFLLVVLAAAGITMKMPKQYTAEASVLLDVKADPLLATLMPQMMSPAYIATEVEVIRSDRVAERVVKMLGLAQSPEAIAKWRESTQGRVPMETYFGAFLQRGLKVQPASGSNLLLLEFSASDSKFAAAAANAFARAYIDVSVDLRVEPARQYNTFYDERLKGLREEFEGAQAKLSAYQREKGIVATDERVDLEMGRLNAIMGELATAQALQAETSSRARNSGGEFSPEVQQSTIVQGLKGELARQEARLSEISSYAGRNHPQRVQLEAQIRELRRQIGAEMRRVSGATETVDRVTSQKIAQLKAMADAQKKHLLSLRAERDEIAVLQKDLETAQRAYEAVAQRRSQLSLESQVTQAAARILSPAVEPVQPSKPNVKKNMMAAVIVGLVLGIAAAVGWEMLDRRIRSATDLHMTAGVPVLGVLSDKAGRGLAPYNHRFPALPPPRSPRTPQLTLGGSTG